MADKEIIDGVGAAARIMSFLPATEQEELLTSIRLVAPQTAITLIRTIERTARSRQKQVSSTSASPIVRRSSVPVGGTSAPRVALADTREALPERLSTELPRLEEQVEVSVSPQSQVDTGEISVSDEQVTDIESAKRRILRRLEELYPDETPLPMRPGSKSSRLA